MKRTYTMVLGAAALAAVLGCSKEAQLYLGGPPGAEARQAISNSGVVMLVGGSAALGARAEDAVGNVTGAAVTFTSVNSSIATVTAGSGDETWTSTGTVNGVGMGSTYITASSGGFTDSILVTVGPVGVSIVGPDTVLSGEEGDYTVVPVDGGGNALTGTVNYEWASSAKSILVVNPTSGVATGRSTGSVSVRLVAPGGANDSKTATVVPSAFTGTFSAASGAAGQVVTITRGAGDPVFDDDAKVVFGTTEAAYYLTHTADMFKVVLPPPGVAGATQLIVANLGTDQLSKAKPFTNTAGAWEDVWFATNTNTSGGVPEATAPEVSSIMDANNDVYFMHAGYGTGAAARGAWNGGSQVDHYFKITTGGTDQTVTMTLTWPNGSDVDLFVAEADGTGLAVAGSGSTTDEALTFTFPANTTLFVGASMWTAGTNVTQMKFHFAGL